MLLKSGMWLKAEVVIGCAIKQQLFIRADSMNDEDREDTYGAASRCERPRRTSMGELFWYA